LSRVLEFPKPAALRSVEERNALIEQHLDLVAPIARAMMKRLPASFDFDDLVSVGRFGLLEAAERWDGRDNFTCWASFKIRYRMLDSVRRRNWRENVHENLDDDDVLTELTTERADQEVCFARETERRVSIALECLNPRERFIVERIYWYGDTRSEVGEKLGLKASRVAQLHQIALAKLTAQLTGQGDVLIAVLLKVA
jgi:RNA polymerase sigma factor (sigma-70 family)